MTWAKLCLFSLPIGPLSRCLPIRFFLFEISICKDFGRASALGTSFKWDIITTPRPLRIELLRSTLVCIETILEGLFAARLRFSG
jgi:hypothetical protein